MKFLIAAICLFLSCNITAQRITGKAVRIADGDTITILLSDNTQVKVRLYGIDCPERGQPYGNVATKFTRDFCEGYFVDVETRGKDRYGRTIGIVTVAGRNLNTELLKAGLAWHYKQYDNSREWASMEDMARSHRKGLWQEPGAVAPWEWRKK